MKKILSFILILVLVFQGTLAAFGDTGTAGAAAESPAAQSADIEEAEEEVISPDAEICLALEIISGAGDVTAEYMKQEATKLTAAVMLLKLRGLYEEAKSYTGSESFRDADKAGPAEEKNIMAYLKKNPQYGFSGDEEDNFNPSETITEQYYYRVLLEALGYKETKESALGDFTREDTLAFAKKAGLTPANVEKPTIDNLASAIVQALRANTSDERVYINKLIEAGRYTKEQVEQAGIYGAEAASVKSAGNTLVKLTFYGAIDKKAVEDKSIYKIEGLATEGFTAAELEIRSAKKMPNGRNVVVLETSPQTCGQVYSIKYGEKTLKFAGLPKAKGGLALVSVREDTEEWSTGEIVVKFDRMVDAASAADISNYSFEGGTIEAARMPTDVEVYFTVKGLAGGKTLKAKVSNITALDGSFLKAAEYNFKLASGSTKAQSVDSVEAGGNTRVMVNFSKTFDMKSALDPANYAIKSASGSLAIKRVDYMSAVDVELVTEPQQTVEYELTVQNVADRKGNLMAKPYKKSFRGKLPTKSRPKITGIKFLERKLIEVSFDSKARLDMASAENVLNYTIDGDAAIDFASPPPINANPADFRKIWLYISPLTLKQKYTLTVEGIKDEYGNEIKEFEYRKTVDKEIVAAAGITGVKSLVGDGDQYVTQVELTFDKQLDYMSAMDISKIQIDGGIGHPVFASYGDMEKNLTLDLPTPLISGKKYTVSINGIKDASGNVLNIEKVPFYAIVAEDDMNPPEISDVSAVNKYVVSVAFDKPIGNVGDAMLELKKVDSNGNPVGDSIILTSKVGYDDDRRVEFSDYPNKLLEDAEYMIVGLNAKNMIDRRYELPAAFKEREVFSGTDEEPEWPEAHSIEQKDAKKFELYFSEKVQIQPGAKFNGLTPSVSVDDKTIGYLKSTGKIESGKVFKADLGDSFTNMHGMKAQNEDEKSETEIEADLDDSEAPYIENLEVIDRNTVKLTFNEGMEKPGAYEIEYENSKEKTVVIKPSAAVGAEEDNTVLLTFSDDSLASEYEYTLRVKADPVDYAGNSAGIKGEEYPFDGTDIKAIDNYITEIEV
ncbi:MAG TPA: Ig-like domain-containing protein, partial [Clostridia bacterium]|nr:Ig-like domain-containing protein [Clostridia bacterium]